MSFDVPFALVPGSDRTEDGQVRSVLQACVKRLGSAGGRAASVRKTSPTQWTFDVPAFQTASSQLQNAAALSALLRCLTDLDEVYRMNRPGAVPDLYDSGVVYDRTVVWDTTPALYVYASSVAPT